MRGFIVLASFFTLWAAETEGESEVILLRSWRVFAQASITKWYGERASAFKNEQTEFMKFWSGEEELKKKVKLGQAGDRAQALIDGERTRRFQFLVFSGDSLSREYDRRMNGVSHAIKEILDGNMAGKVHSRLKAFDDGELRRQAIAAADFGRNLKDERIRRRHYISLSNWGDPGLKTLPDLTNWKTGTPHLLLRLGGKPPREEDNTDIMDAIANVLGGVPDDRLLLGDNHELSYLGKNLEVTFHKEHRAAKKVEDKFLPHPDAKAISSAFRSVMSEVLHRRRLRIQLGISDE